MNQWNRLKQEVERYKAEYPTGTRILLVRMGEDPRPVADNTMGTVIAVDDIGTIHCEFDDGRCMGIVPGEDVFRKLTDEDIYAGNEAQMGM